MVPSSPFVRDHGSVASRFGGAFRSSARTIVICCAASFVVPAAAPAQAPSPSRVDELVKKAVGEFAEGQAPTASFTLDAAVKMALEKNLGISVERANPEIAALDISAAQAAYLPTLGATIGDQRQIAPPVTVLTGGTRVQTTTTTVNFTATQNVPAGGGTLAVTWDNSRIFTNSFFYNFNPAYNASLAFQYTQPLLRGFRTDPAREQVAVSRINRSISEMLLQATIANTVSDVRNAYWDLVFAVRAIDVARRSVDLAHQLVQDNQAQVKYGTMTSLDLTTAASQEASSRHALVQAEGNRRIAELALKRLLVNGPDDALWQATIEPVDRPEATEQAIDVASAVRRALAERSDLQQARRQASANQAATALLREQARPQADLVAGYQLTGVGGTQVLRTGNLFDGAVVGTIPGGYGNTLSTLFGRDFPTWTLALTVSYPVGQSAARAAAARADVQNRQVEMQVRQLEVRVVSEVTDAAIQVRNQFDQVQAARSVRDAAVQRLDAEQKKFHAGVVTNYFVVQAQRDLADAENSLLQAEVGYRKALVEFERVQQTTVQGTGVTVVRNP